MSTRQPVLLTVVIEPKSHRWFAAGIDHQGSATPLICSQQGSLATYIGEPFDSQVSILRHRLAGVLQRGCDRLWYRDQKPCQIVFVADGLFSEAPAGLTQRVAEHFVEWLASPPVVFYLLETRVDCRPELQCVAGEISADDRRALDDGLPAVLSACADDEQWELVPTKPGQ